MTKYWEAIRTVKIEKILFPTELRDHSLKILPYVVAMADKFNSTIYLLPIIEDLSKWGGFCRPHLSLDVYQKDAMENTFWTALGASFLSAIVTTIGIYVMRRFERWGSGNTIYFICFAAGVLISVSFLHIVPKAFSMNAHAPFYLFAGYISLHLFNRFINAFVCDKSSDAKYGIGLGAGILVALVIVLSKA